MNPRIDRSIKYRRTNSSDGSGHTVSKPERAVFHAVRLSEAAEVWHHRSWGGYCKVGYQVGRSTAVLRTASLSTLHGDTDGWEELRSRRANEQVKGSHVLGHSESRGSGLAG